MKIVKKEKTVREVCRQTYFLLLYTLKHKNAKKRKQFFEKISEFIQKTNLINQKNKKVLEKMLNSAK